MLGHGRDGSLKIRPLSNGWLCLASPPCQARSLGRSGRPPAKEKSAVGKLLRPCTDNCRQKGARRGTNSRFILCRARSGHKSDGSEINRDERTSYSVAHTAPESGF